LLGLQLTGDTYRGGETGPADHAGSRPTNIHRKSQEQIKVMHACLTDLPD